MDGPLAVFEVGTQFIVSGPLELMWAFIPVGNFVCLWVAGRRDTGKRNENCVVGCGGCTE